MFLQVAALVGVLSVASPAPQQPAAPQLLAIEHNLIYYANLQRQQFGLAPLAVDPSLLRSARGHAWWMARSNALVHTSLPVAENIAMGQQSSLEAVTSWMSSPGHRANLLSPSYTRIGAAAYTSPSGAIYWCVQFN